ncbi:MAG: hypothetical protein NZ693_06935 [Thermoflexales bacterium]|nr:hypothetical protein [Thermoflexales bacterium]
MNDPVGRDPSGVPQDEAALPSLAERLAKPSRVRSPSTPTPLPPRTGRVAPRTELLLPSDRRSRLRLVGGIVAAVLLVIGGLIALRFLTDDGCQDFDAITSAVALDGVKLVVQPSDLTGRFGVQLERVPRAEMLSRSESTARIAAANLPALLVAQSDFTQIRACSVPPRRAVVRAALPPGLTPTPDQWLDLYGWYHQSREWRWLGAALDETAREVEAQVYDIPDGVVLARWLLQKPQIVAELSHDSVPPEGVSALFAELTAPVLYLVEMGRVISRSEPLSSRAVLGNTPVIPSVRNWGVNGEVNRTVLREMLTNPTARETHLFGLLSIINSGGYAGIQIDYRGVDAELADSFATFIQLLSKRLSEQRKRLVLALPAPEPSGDGFTLPGYDLPRLLPYAAVVKVDLTSAPDLLVEENLARVLRWARSNIDPSKLHFVLPADSLRRDASGRTAFMSMEEALRILGGVQLEQDAVQPGATLALRWAGQARGRTPQRQGAFYTYTYLDDRGIQQTVWLVTSFGLQQVLAQIQPYQVQGITLRGALRAGNDEGTLALLERFANNAVGQTQMPPPVLQVAFGASTPYAIALDDPAPRVQAPGGEGEYEVHVAFRGGRSIELTQQRLKVSRNAPSTSALDPGAQNGEAQPIRIVSPSDFEIGGHVFDTRHGVQMRSAGMRWMRVGVRGFKIPTDFIAEAKRQEMKVLVTAVGDRARVLDELYQQEWAQHLGQIAAAGADAIEIWLEPNYEAEWPRGRINGATYADLLRRAYAAIKAANPQTLVISGGMAQTDDAFGGGCTDAGCDEYVFLAQMSSAGAAAYLDCIGVQYTFGRDAPDVVGGEYYARYLRPFIATMASAFNNQKPLCFTALGYLSAEGLSPLPASSPFAYASTISSEQQAKWLGEAVAMLRESGKVRLVVIWNVDGSVWRADEPQAGYAMIRPDGACLACEAVRAALESR